MSLICRAIFISKRKCSYTSNSNILRLTFKVPSSTTGNCKYKMLEILSPLIRRHNSISSNIRPEICNIKHAEVDDQTTNEKELIYTGILTKPVRRIKFFSLFSSLLGITIQPYIYLKVVSTSTVPTLTVPLCITIAIFSVISPILLHSIAKKYVINIEYIPKSDKYIATVYNFFAIKRKIEFTPGDVTIPTVLGVFANCAIKQESVFIDAKLFANQNHYVKIMGYDKPFDITEEKNCSKEK